MTTAMRRITLMPKTGVMIDESPAVDIWTVGGAKTSFTIGIGGYTQAFSSAKVRTTTEPVLSVRNDHWPEEGHSSARQEKYDQVFRSGIGQEMVALTAASPAFKNWVGRILLLKSTATSASN
jgi:hypothetical protein